MYWCLKLNYKETFYLSIFIITNLFCTISEIASDLGLNTKGLRSELEERIRYSTVYRSLFSNFNSCFPNIHSYFCELIEFTWKTPRKLLQVNRRVVRFVKGV